MPPPSIRTKTLWVVAGTTAVLTVLLALDMLSLLGPSYKELDRRFATRERIRMEQHFVARLDNLKASARDWGVWDGMAQWVKDRNSAFARENLQLANLVNAGFARLSVFDTSGGVLVSIADGEVPAAIDKWAAREASHWAVRRDTTVVAGMTVQKGRIWSIVLQPVRSGSGVEPPRALLMLASPAGVGNVNDGVVRFHSVAMESIADTDSLVLHGQLPGLEGLPIAQFTLKVDRVVWSGGQRTLLYLGIGAILFALAFVAIVYRFLDRTLLQRLHLLKLDLETIRSFPTRGSRIRSLGEDEIGQVGSQVNATFDALEESQKHLADAQRIARLGFWQLDLETFKAQISSEHVETAGLEVDARNFEITFDDYLDRYVHPDDRDRLRAWAEFAKTRETEEVSRDLEYRTIGPEGEVRHLSAACRKRSGEERILFLVAQDVTDRRRMEEEILRGNLYDSLTGLPNRSLLLDRIRAVLEHGFHRPCSILVVTLDRFQSVNASLGREVGDGLFLGVSVRLVGALPPGTTVGRISHETFCVLLEIDDHAELNRIAESLRQVVRTPLPLGGRELMLTGSIGVAIVNPGECGPEEALNRAESAVFQASARGGDCISYFDEEHSRVAREKVDLEMELGKAMPDQLELHYQPIVHLTDGTVAGFEALLRWRHPVRGMISPMMFIPIAERSGLIHPIGLWVMEEAMRVEAAWKKEFGEDAPFMSINLSVKQFLHDDLADQIRLCLHKSGVEPTGIKLEITESALSEDPGHVTELLENLVSTGIRFSLDDFGTGYSSLGYLSSFPVQTLKVDKSFVDQIGEDGKKTRITSAIVSLAHTLGMDVVAEGIETESQWKYLLQLGCEYGQGYHFARPLPLAAAQAYLEKQMRERVR